MSAAWLAVDTRPGEERMVLRSTTTSPYGRKVRMASMVLGLDERLDLIASDTLDPDDDLRQLNPLGKMPCLVTSFGPIFDSRVILEFLDEMAGGGRLIPCRGVTRYKALTLAALADGMTDAALLVTYEHRFREVDQVSTRWLDHQREKIRRALAALAARPPDAARSDCASISLACALGYLDWRAPLDWRVCEPDLARWLDVFARHERAFAATKAPS